MPDSYIIGLPGIRATKTATHKIVFKQGDWLSDLALGKIINGTASRDPTNTGNPENLQPGLLMGKRTSDGFYAPSIMGLNTVAISAGATTITVAAATAVELNRRVGASGTFQMAGPPAAAGVMNQETVTYSAVNVTTGVITCTATVNAYVINSFVQPNDGSQTILTLIPDGYGIRTIDTDGANLNVQFPMFPIAGVIISNTIVNWPTDTSLQSRIVAMLNAAAGGQFVFDHMY